MTRRVLAAPAALVAAASMSACSPTAAAKTARVPAVDPAPAVRFESVEVVSDDADVVRRVRAEAARAGLATPVEAAVDDGRLTAACDALRAGNVGAGVQCFPIIMGGGAGIFVVQFAPASSGEAGPARCSAAARLDPSLARQAAAFGEIQLGELRRTRGHVREFVNELGYLDTDNAVVGPAVRALHRDLGGRVPELVRAVDSCVAQERAAALMLLNYAGQPRSLVDAALARVQDPDEMVRNEAMRALGRFSDHLPPGSLQSLSLQFCAAAGSPSFFDRNKGLAGIYSLLAGAAGRRRTLLPSDCLARIERIAGLSSAPQTGGYATQILRLIEQDSRRPAGD